jgi:outer membrane protein assembly factor BamB
VRALIVTVLTVVGCQQGPPAPSSPPESKTVYAEPIVHTPFVIGNRIVAEDGTVLRVLREVGEGEHAVPTGPHRFEVVGYAVDTASGSVTRIYPPAAMIPRQRADPGREYTLARTEPDGRTRWSTEVHGVRSVRPPDIAVGGGRTIVKIDATIHAFDDATGKPVWTQPGGDRLTIAGDNVISTFCNLATHDHWLIANALVDGNDRFRVALPEGCDPWIAVVDERIYVVDDHKPAHTLIFDFAGKQLARLDEELQGAHHYLAGAASHKRSDGTRVLVTDQGVLAIDAAGNVVWRGPATPNEFVGGADFAELPGGDLIVANYGAINDSGVDVVRLRADGSVRWHASAAPLMVAHSEYLHLAYIEVRGDQLFVISQGSSGAFLERMSVATGERELRCVIGEPCTRPAAAP